MDATVFLPVLLSVLSISVLKTSSAHLFLVFAFILLVRFFALPSSFSCLCSQPIQIRFLGLFNIKRERVSNPDLIALRPRLTQSMALSFTPRDGCILAVVLCSHDGCLALLSS